MNTESDKQERGRLQHAAEHERPRRRGSVLIYLVILFAAAFLVLLMSFLMQQRANQEAIDNLQQTSESAVQSLENLLQENEALKEQNGALQTQLDELQGQLDGAAQAEQEELGALQAAPSTTTTATPTPGTWPPPRRPPWPAGGAWRGCWGRSPPPSPRRSGRTTTPWRPTAP